MILASVAAALFSLHCTVAGGVPLYDQPTLHSHNDLGAYAYFGQEVADDFSLSSDGVVGTVTWKGGYWVTPSVTGPESFTVHVYTDDGGLPAVTPLYSFIGDASPTPTADTRSGQTIYDYHLDIADLPLSAGTLYWISIYTNANPFNYYAWSNSADGSPDGAYRNSGGSWNQHDHLYRANHVFALNPPTVIPEPSTFIIWSLLGALAITLRWWRRGR
jgi:hypothetical protein